MDALMDLINDLKTAKAAAKTGCRAGNGAGLPAQGAVLSGFRRGGKFDGLPRAAGGSANSRRVD
jgi:hypothetical protein